MIQDRFPTADTEGHAIFCEALRETLRETPNSLRDIIALAKARNVLVKLRDIAD